MVSYFRSSNNREFLMKGLSSDAKPIDGIPNGAKFIEIDTGKQYLFDVESGEYCEIESGGGSGGDAKYMQILTDLIECDIVSLEIPNGATKIGDSALSYRLNLESVTIPDSVTSIGEFAFQYDDALTGITISDNVSSIGVGAFEGCTHLESVSLPEGLLNIEDRLFSDCSALSSIAIPSGVTSIGEEAFYNCSSITTIAIPSTVANIGVDAFSGCTSLKRIDCDFAQGAVAGEPWGAPDTTRIVYSL